jgi:hypothetical protein
LLIRLAARRREQISLHESIPLMPFNPQCASPPSSSPADSPIAVGGRERSGGGGGGGSSSGSSSLGTLTRRRSSAAVTSSSLRRTTQDGSAPNLSVDPFMAQFGMSAVIDTLLRRAFRCKSPNIRVASIRLLCEVLSALIADHTAAKATDPTTVPYIDHALIKALVNQVFRITLALQPGLQVEDDLESEDQPAMLQLGTSIDSTHVTADNHGSVSNNNNNNKNKNDVDRPALGFIALECLALVQQLVQANVPAVDAALLQANTLQHVADILFNYVNNNIAQARVVAILTLVLAGNDSHSSLRTNLLIDYKLASKIASAISHDQKLPIATPRIGPLFSVALLLHTESCCKAEVAISKRWPRFVKRHLLPHQELISATTLHRENSYVDQERGELWNTTREQFTFLLSE